MIRFISVALFVVIFLILSIPLLIAEWIIGKIKDGISICIFPEGTRNKIADTFLPFHAGSFKIAEKSGCPIIPIALNNAGDVFEDHFPKIKKTHVVIEYGEPIYPNELSKEEKKKLADITLERIKEMYFKNKELV